MTTISRLSCMAATAFVLIFGNAIAADDAEAQPAKPDMTNGHEQQPNPQPKEEATSKNGSDPKASKEEPECN